ncbi:MAG: helical backbone metal receptor [Candidatus Aureabacteria bacterium]|nr:helical backbone metal receptor [Candidatus Auribacterota bacterium]
MSISTCDYPPEAAGKERVGDLWTPSVEKIFSLSPDLVLTTQEGNRPQTVETLRKLGLRVFVSPPARSLEEYFERLVELGRIVGAETRAGELIAEFRSEIARARRGAAGRASPRIFFQLGSAPIVSAARGTIIHELIEIAGGVNISADSPLRYPSFSREKVVADDPEIILIAAMGGEGEKCRDEWMAFAGMAAVKTGRIYFIDPDLVCRLSPRLVEGLRTLAGMIQKKSDQ